MDRYRNEVNRLYGVLDRRLADNEYMAGEYSIADMASYPWVIIPRAQHQNLADFPHIKRWLDSIKARPRSSAPTARRRRSIRHPGGIRHAEERRILFGQTAASVSAAVR
jgi:GST-like protein